MGRGERFAPERVPGFCTILYLIRILRWRMGWRETMPHLLVLIYGRKGAVIWAGNYSIVVCGWSEFERYWEKKFMGVRLWLVTAAEEELSCCF